MVMDAVGSAASAVGGALGLIKPDKAEIKVVGKNVPAGDQSVKCMFNPTEYRLTTAVAITANPTPAVVGGTPQFGGTGPITLTAQLFFDDFASLQGDVTPRINTLLGWTRPTASSLKDQKPCPPMVAFRWGPNPQLTDFQGYLTNVTVNYTLFRRDGTPVQAKVDITIQFAKDPDKEVGTNPTSHAANSRRVHTMIDGDTLQSVAYRELGKAGYWRAIAELNGIDDPLRISAGTTLLIPSRADAARSG
jgi:hypothetical protein